VTNSIDAQPLLTSGHRVRVLTLNRPARGNSLDPELHRALVDALRAARSDPRVLALVLTGAGSAFSAGGDLELIRQLRDDDEARQDTFDTARALFNEMTMGKPIIAAVNGPAVGAGCTLALACDVVFMAEDTFLADPHIQVGLVPGDGGAALWPMLTSLATAKAYLLTGDRVPAAEAFRLGLVHQVVEREEVLGVATRMAERIADRPAAAVCETKRALGLHLGGAAANAFDAAMAAEDRSFDTPEHHALTSPSEPNE
jgi:enoyl-CoA hydratase/carnithine racemase